jgi:hypothetical protein
MAKFRFGTLDNVTPLPIACNACARAMPIDTAVAATISETASANVAINSIPSLRRRDNVLSETGDAKPTIPVSAVMVVHPCRELWRISLWCRNVAPDLGEAVEE